MHVLCVHAYFVCMSGYFIPVICVLQEVEALRDALDLMHQKFESKEAELEALLRVNSEHLDMIQLVSLLLLVVIQFPRKSHQDILP